MALTRHRSGRVEPIDKTPPPPDNGQIAVTVLACGVCRTDLHVVDGDLPNPTIPIIPGHEIVGRVERVGSGVSGFAPGDRVGIPWLGYACGHCEFCRSGRENLCPNARYTGYQIDGGYGEQAIASAIARIEWLVTRSGLASTDSVQRRTSSRRSPCSRAVRSLPL